MASTQDIRRRIKSVKNIQQITKAMKMVAAARLRRAQEGALANKPYAEKMQAVLRALQEVPEILIIRFLKFVQLTKKPM